MRKTIYPTRGKPVTHPPVRHIETGNVYDTYIEAAKAVGGNRWGVRYTAIGIQRSHKGQHFEYVKTKKKGTIT